jgi:hypothetical protein
MTKLPFKGIIINALHGTSNLWFATFTPEGKVAGQNFEGITYHDDRLALGCDQVALVSYDEIDECLKFEVECTWTLCSNWMIEYPLIGRFFRRRVIPKAYKQGKLRHILETLYQSLDEDRP